MALLKTIASIFEWEFKLSFAVNLLLLQTQLGTEAATGSSVARDARGHFEAEGGGQVEALQLHHKLGFANDSVQAVRVSDRGAGRRGKRTQTEGRIN